MFRFRFFVSRQRGYYFGHSLKLDAASGDASASERAAAAASAAAAAATIELPAQSGLHLSERVTAGRETRFVFEARGTPLACLRSSTTGVVYQCTVLDTTDDGAADQANGSAEVAQPGSDATLRRFAALVCATESGPHEVRASVFTMIVVTR